MNAKEKSLLEQKKFQREKFEKIKDFVSRRIAKVSAIELASNATGIKDSVSEYGWDK